MDNVLAWLMNYCLKNKIGVVYDNNLPPQAPSVSYSEPKLVIFNDNHKGNDRPFILAHEIGHVVGGDSRFYHLACLGVYKSEFSANMFAINLLFKYCLAEDIWYSSVYDFAKAFGIPSSVWYLFDNHKCFIGDEH